MIQMHKMVKNLGMDIWKYREGWDKTVISSGLLGGTSGATGKEWAAYEH